MPKVPFWIFICLALLYFSAARVDTMDIDASQYAEMSREMVHSGDYLHLYDRGMNYLDKPPFLFWVSSTSMRVFGVNNFGYKFPSILFALWALYVVYRLGRMLYDEDTGRMAALILGSCQGLFLMTNDVRCDTILMSWVITAIWLIKEYEVHKKLRYLLLGCAAIAFGMMTKGPIAIIVPVFCFVSDWVLKRKWGNFFKPAYLLGIIVIAVLLIPMTVGLYQQFDAHPDALVNNMHGVSGIRFFYWTQSFGRITGENVWSNGADISFLLLNMLWSFLPWILLFLVALVINVVKLVDQKFRLKPHQEWLTYGGFILSYLSLGSSSYQLPHYIFIAFPLAAIITAKLLRDFFENKKYQKLYKVMFGVQAGLIVLLFAVCLVLLTYIFPSGAFSVVLWAVCFAVWLYLALKKGLCGKLFWLSAVGMILINIFLTNYVYVHLLQYEAGPQIGRYIKHQHIDAGKVIIYRTEDPLVAVHFYADHLIAQTDDSSALAGKQYIITMDKGLNDIKQRGIAVDVVKQGDFFSVSQLTPQFLNPGTRSQAVHPYYVLRVKNPS